MEYAFFTAGLSSLVSARCSETGAEAPVEGGIGFAIVRERNNSATFLDFFGGCGIKIRKRVPTVLRVAGTHLCAPPLPAIAPAHPARGVP